MRPVLKIVFTEWQRFIVYVTVVDRVYGKTKRSSNQANQNASCSSQIPHWIQ